MTYSKRVSWLMGLAFWRSGYPWEPAATTRQSTISARGDARVQCVAAQPWTRTERPLEWGSLLGTRRLSAHPSSLREPSRSPTPRRRGSRSRLPERGARPPGHRAFRRCFGRCSPGRRFLDASLPGASGQSHPPSQGAVSAPHFGHRDSTASPVHPHPSRRHWSGTPFPYPSSTDRATGAGEGRASHFRHVVAPSNSTSRVPHVPHTRAESSFMRPPYPARRRRVAECGPRPDAEG